MLSRTQFAEKLACLNLTRIEEAIALLWYYRHTQTYEERSASELADDLRDEGFGRPNVTNLNNDLRNSPKTVRGRRAGTFQINVRYLDELKSAYGPLIDLKEIEVSSSILPIEFGKGTRHVERMIEQINGSYDYYFYDGCAVMIRRLMETLIIEVFIHKKIVDDIREDGIFVGLDKLITKISNHSEITLSRGAEKRMQSIKESGDTAAHDRTYITNKQDIDDSKLKIRKTLTELLNLCGKA